MPFYEYQCSSCGQHLEAMQKISDAPIKKCPQCGKPTLKRLMSAPVFRLKGAGWYETDFKSEQDSKRNLADKPDPDAPKEDKDAKKESTETKPAEKTAEEASKPVDKPADKAADKVEVKSKHKAVAATSSKAKSPARRKPAAKIKRRR
jgi:putative FmdB family regulatory protein